MQGNINRCYCRLLVAVFAACGLIGCSKKSEVQDHDVGERTFPVKNSQAHTHANRSGKSEIKDISQGIQVSSNEWNTGWKKARDVDDKKILLKKACEVSDPLDLIRWINSNVGKGRDRNEYIREIYASSKMSAEQILASLELLDDSDRRGAYTGISSSISFRENVDDCGILLSKSNDSLRNCVIQGLGSWLYRNSRDEVSAGLALAKLRSLISSSNDMDEGKTMYRFATRIPTSWIGAFGVWNLIKSNGILNNESVSKSHGYGLETRLIVGMLEESPERAMRFFSDGAQANIFSLAMTKYLAKNEKDALSWMERNNSMLSQDMRDEGYSVLVKEVVNSGDVDSALQFANRISDNEIKEVAMGKIDSKVVSMVIDDMKKEPLKTMNKIAKNESRYNSGHLEDAMYYWVKSDFDAARIWYENTWNSIDENQKQYIAAAFARQAVVEGDFENANAWKAYIVNESVIKRVDEVIQKAGGR